MQIVGHVGPLIVKFSVTRFHEYVTMIKIYKNIAMIKVDCKQLLKFFETNVRTLRIFFLCV